jgi:hypothetical protein
MRTIADAHRDAYLDLASRSVDIGAESDARPPILGIGTNIGLGQYSSGYLVTLHQWGRRKRAMEEACAG